MVEPAPVYRPSGRVLLLDGRARLLLLQQLTPEEGPGRLWIAPGGGLERGESFEEAARRELWEETGVEVAAPLPLVWARRVVFPWGGRRIDSDERFFLARLPEPEIEVVAQALDPVERATLDGHHWWDVADIAAAADHVFAPSRLAELLPPLIAGQLPPTPIEVGA